MLDAILILKVCLAPVLILAASLAGHRWGNTVSGWIVGLPLVSAPVILLLALERGNEFAAASAQGSLLGIVSLSAFSLAYAWLSLLRGQGWLLSMLAGWGVYFAATFALGYAAVSIFAAFICVVAWLRLVMRIFPTSNTPVKAAPQGGFPWVDVAVRMVAAVGLTFAITEYAPVLGPTLSGLLIPFPIYTSVMVTSLHRGQGATSVFQFLRGAIVSSFTPALFWLIVGSTIVQWGIGPSYALAIAASVMLHWVLLKTLLKNGAT